jgi:hypothetical protein
MTWGEGSNEGSKQSTLPMLGARSARELQNEPGQSCQATEGGREPAESTSESCQTLDRFGCLSAIITLLSDHMMLYTSMYRVSTSSEVARA